MKSYNTQHNNLQWFVFEKNCELIEFFKKFRRTNANTRNRGGSHFSTSNGDDRPATVAVNRGTHPP